ncbi:phospholipid scramblase 1 [Pseudorasbora parva]|uniref:phospholipid scramblase 1 n=1 Tax=Pseudorasbora parva TaxID=51549 RepID=UPI00351DAB83
MSKTGCPPNPKHQPEGSTLATPATEIHPDNQPPPVQPALNPSDNPAPHQVLSHGGSPQKDLQNPMAHPEGPAAELQAANPPPPIQPTLKSSDTSNPGCPPQTHSANPMPQIEGTELASSATELKNRPPPVQTVMNPSDPINAAPCQIKLYGGYPVQFYLPNPMPQPEGSAPAPPVELQPVNQPAPVQPVMIPSGPSNPAPHQVQPYAGYPVQNYLPNPIPQPEQYISPYPKGGYGVPGQAPQPAVNQEAPVQPVMNPSASSNSTPHQVQLYAGSAPQNNLPNLPHGPTPAPPVELQPGNQPVPVQSVMNPSGPSNPAPDQVQPYAPPAAPPLVIPFGVPPGLEYLTQIDQILIHQKISCIEMFTSFETKNQYEIKNSIGQEIYHAKEKSDCFTRNVFGSARPFQMRIKDNTGQEVIRLHRPLRCFLQEIEVQAPLGVTIGYVKQEWSCFLPRFSILGPHNEILLQIQGPFLPLKCCGDINFEVISMAGGKAVGRIIKQRSGFLKKCFTDATNFCIQFPLDMDVKMKTLLMGACFLIDIMFFDKGGQLFLKLI